MSSKPGGGANLIDGAIQSCYTRPKPKIIWAFPHYRSTCIDNTGPMRSDISSLVDPENGLVSRRYSINLQMDLASLPRTATVFCVSTHS